MQPKFACALLLFAASHAAAAVQILPTPLSDRTFQFVHISQTFLGTPLQIEALTPYALFVIGAGEDPGLYIQAATLRAMRCMEHQRSIDCLWRDVVVQIDMPVSWRRVQEVLIEGQTIRGRL